MASQDSLLSKFSAPSTPRVAQARTRLGPAPGALVPAVLAFAAAGLALGFLGWLLTHGTQQSLAQVYRDGAFLLYEGERQEGDVPSAQLMGLTIVSAASTVVSILAPMTPALYAYHVARAWLAGPLHHPTLEQYGVLVGLLGTGSLPAIGRAGAYLARGGQRPRVPRMLVQAALVTLVAHILAYAVSGVDLWLHTVAATVVQTVDTPPDVPLSRSFAQTNCQPYASNSSDDLSAGMTRCIGPFTGPEASAMLGGTQMAVMSNHSRNYQAHTLADAGDLAVLVDPTVNANMSFTMTTFGARATCTLLMPPQCTLPAGLSGNVTCNGFPPGEFPPFNLTADSLPGSTAPGASALFMLSSNCADCAHVDPTTYRYNNQALATQGAPPENRYSLWLQMVWQHGQGRGPMHAAASGAYLTNMQCDALLADCTLAFSNVTLAHRSGAYTVAAETPSNAGLADGLAAATRVGTTSAQDDSARAALDTKESAAEIFEETLGEERVHVGLHERANGQVVFGLWRRHDGTGARGDTEG